MAEIAFEKSKLVRAGIILLIVWFIASLIFVGNLFSATKGFAQSLTAESLEFTPDFVIIFGLSLLLSVFSFFPGIGLLIGFFIKNEKLQSPEKMSGIGKFLFTFLIFPFYCLKILFLSVKNSLGSAKIIPVATSLFVVFVFVPIWLGSYYALGSTLFYVVSDFFGYAPIEQGVSGTGSMYPTFPKGDAQTDRDKAKEVVATANFIRYPNGIAIGSKRFLNHELQRGDIIIFENAATKKITEEKYGEANGFLKRLIALPGDTLELRGGIVYLNNKPLVEPYTAKARSTFAESFLSECKKITIPANKVFAMGDNRKGSGDSREIGFIDLQDVENVLTLESQKGKWDKNWRNTSHDFDDSAKIRINKEEYLSLVNAKRKEAGVDPLKYQEKLEDSARRRGQVMLKYDDRSFQASRSGYTMLKAMTDAGYWNPAYGEAPSQGYFDAEELIENQFEFPESKEFLLDKDFDEFGISEVEGVVNGCPTQVIVLHFAGYIPPNYKQSDIDSWQKAYDNLKSIQSGWSSLKETGKFYFDNKSDIDRINDIISLRLANISAVLSRMKANQWLTPAEDKMADQDDALADEENSIADKLNSK